MSEPTISMNKVIHAAVRRDLDRFAVALREFSEGDTGRAADLHRAWENFDEQLTHHHEGEHEIAWPALRAIGVPEADITRFDEEHEAMAAALVEARGRMAALGRSATRADADTAAAAIEHLKAATLPHLAAEEELTEPLFGEYHDHPAMKQMTKQFGRQSPKVGGVFFAWLLDGSPPAETAALRSSVPGPVLAILTGVFGRRYKKEIAPVWS
jgi:iron-sulfur cluster repair protein YtfE (RIC family)